jgi:hypothetical protein
MHPERRQSNGDPRRTSARYHRGHAHRATTMARILRITGVVPSHKCVHAFAVNWVLAPRACGAPRQSIGLEEPHAACNTRASRFYIAARSVCTPVRSRGLWATFRTRDLNSGS